ncbi:ABC transporter permease [Mesoplasma chauliocola]|uniref:ABC transporter permease n=1 Tax=Mesoplasma chauliocola TaxID=216427 RepID=A0A249SN45_9MOLU|nr:ABC transporter permease [Mesoplasma chauliocola]ASZ09017.1 ABC transporter permease [Mesoplasma chauliocola]
MKNSNWLLFKQGLKGIFKFKIQFVIILILSFLSIFILTTSISLKDRLNNTYNQIVKSVDKFDYEYIDEFYGKSGSINASQTSQNLMLMYVNNDSYSVLNNLKEFNLSFNKIYSGETFITKAFEDEKMKSIFSSNQLKTISTEFSINVRNLLMLYFYKDLSNALNNLDLESESVLNLMQTPIYKYAKTLDSAEIKNDYDYILGESENWKFDQNNFLQNKGLEDLEKIQNKNFFIYTYAAFTSIVAYIADLNNYLELTDYDTTTPELYEIITGNKHNSSEDSKNRVVTDQNKYSLNHDESNSNIIQLENESKTKIVEAIINEGLKGITTPIFKFETSDLISNTVVNKSTFKLESSVSSDDWSSRMTVLGDDDMTKEQFNYVFNKNLDLRWITEGGKYTNATSSEINTKEDNMIQQVLSLAYNTQLKIAANNANVKTELRREFFIYDNVTQRSYKLVVLDDMQTTKLKVLNPDKGGRLPLNKGEILISEQFARANKISLFSDIKLGIQNLTISGFATDTFSYFPIVNDELPIPQPKNSAIIYGSAETLRSILVDSTSGQGEKINQSQFKRFIWLDDNSNINEYNRLFAPSKEPIEFNNSTYRFSWEMQPKVILAYSLFTIIISLIIGVIALIGLLISLKKSINANAKQIGILKALGVKPQNIAVSYIAQSVIIALFIIPLSWGIGLLLQSMFVHLFIPYFSIQLYQFQISFLPLILGFIFFGLLSVLVSFMTAWKLTNKPVMEILKVQEVNKKASYLLNKMKLTIFNKSKFTLKFSITLAATNRKNIYLMTIIIFITSFLVSIGFSIPAMVRTAEEAYYKNIEYANSYDYVENVSNAPLSKGSISYSKSPDEIDKDYTKHGDIWTYSNASNYFESTYDTSPISKYLYRGINNESPVYVNTFKYIASDKANISEPNNSLKADESGLFQLITEQFGNNFANGIGSQFSIGTIEQVFGLISNSLYDVTTLNPDTNQTTETSINDAMVKRKYDIITKNLTQAIPLILQSILGTQASNENDDWKDQILSIITGAAPSFVQSYIQDPSRVQQYSFGYGVKKIFKDDESFATNIRVQNEDQSIKLTGLESNQKAFQIDDKTSNSLFIDQKVLNDLEKVFNGELIENDIVYNGFKYYDRETNTIYAPIAPNKQAENAYKINKNSNISNINTSQNQLLFEHLKNGKVSYDVLPKYAWIYDDSNFINSDYFDKSWTPEQKNEIINNRSGVYSNQHQYLNLYEMDNNKFTYKYQYTKQDTEKEGLTTLDNNAYLFNDFAVKDNKGVSYVRPYYQYSDIKLFLPKALLSQDQLNGYDKWANYNTDSENDDVKGYYDNNVDVKDIPLSTRKAWEAIYGQKASDNGYIMIKPYSMEYSLTEENSKNRGLENIIDTKSDSSWYLHAIRSGLLKQASAEVKYVNNGLKINLQSVGTLDSYNGNITLIDQGLANLIANYSIARKYDVNYNFFEPEIAYKAGENIPSSNGPIISNYDKYKLHDEKKDLYVNDWTNMLNNGEESLNYTQMMWNNAKYSNINEPTDLTTGFLQTTQENNGILLLSQIPISNITTSSIILQVANQRLLSTEKDLIAQISQLAISVAMLIIVSVIITSSLLIILIGDIYITHYQRFMILMKSFGYSNWKVQKYSFGTVTILSVIAWILAMAMACGLIALLLLAIKAFGLAIPFIISWWPFVASLAVVSLSYFGSLILISKKLRNGDPASLLMETHE